MIFEAHTNLSDQYEQLQEEVTFLKDQIKALWQKPTGDTNVTQMPLSSTKEPTQKPPNSSADDEVAQPSSPKKDDQQQLLLVEIPTENRFSALDDSHQEPSVSIPPAKPPIVNTQPPPPTNRSITTQNNSDTLPDNVTLNPAIFLCDSNGKFLNKTKIFPSNQEIKCFRFPRIETARALLQDIYDSPNVIVIHTGTIDLTASSPLNDFIYNLTTLITQASTKFPHSKDIPISAQIFQFTRSAT